MKTFRISDKKLAINWLRYKLLYFTLSLFLIALSLFSLLKWGVVRGIDFTGGINIEYKLSTSFSTEEAIQNLKNKQIEVASIQSIGENNYLFRLGEVNQDKKDSIKNELKNLTEDEVEEVRFEAVGPSIGPELIKKTIYAISVATGAILLWVAFQFKSIKFGASAILAMLHDSFILTGSFSLLGHFWGYEIDFLFITALLTTLSFSVHDTIVVFDRIRELRKKHGGSIADISNKALTETMRRSINNSVTIALMLISLIIFGGETVKSFALALLIGTVLGTYSSPFVAVPLLVTWDTFQKRIKK